MAILRVTDGLDYSGILTNIGQNTATESNDIKNEFTLNGLIFSQSSESYIFLYNPISIAHHFSCFNNSTVSIKTINSSADLSLNYTSYQQGNSDDN